MARRRAPCPRNPQANEYRTNRLAPRHAVVIVTLCGLWLPISSPPSAIVKAQDSARRQQRPSRSPPQRSSSGSALARCGHHRMAMGSRAANAASAFPLARPRPSAIHTACPLPILRLFPPTRHELLPIPFIQACLVDSGFFAFLVCVFLPSSSLAHPPLRLASCHLARRPPQVTPTPRTLLAPTSAFVIPSFRGAARVRSLCF